MDITFEKVEKLMDVAKVSYEEAKDALTRADGDLLEAVIILEQEGKINNGTGAYSTNEDPTASSNTAGRNNNYSQNYQGQNTNTNSSNNAYTNANTNSNSYNYNNRNYKYKDESTDFGDFLKSIGVWLTKVLKASLQNNFDVFRYGERILHVPVLALVILMLAGFWCIIPLLIVGLFFSCRYSFSGPHLGKENVRRGMDKAMNAATDAAETVKESIKNSQEYQQYQKNQQSKQNQQNQQYQNYQQNQQYQNNQQNQQYQNNQQNQNTGYSEANFNNNEGRDTNGREDSNN